MTRGAKPYIVLGKSELTVLEHFTSMSPQTSLTPRQVGDALYADTSEYGNYHMTRDDPGVRRNWAARIMKALVDKGFLIRERLPVTNGTPSYGYWIPEEMQEAVEERVRLNPYL